MYLPKIIGDFGALLNSFPFKPTIEAIAFARHQIATQKKPFRRKAFLARLAGLFEHSKAIGMGHILFFTCGRLNRAERHLAT